MDQKDKFIADLLAKYKIALTRLDEALNKINNQPTTLEEFAASNDALRSQLDELIQWKVRGKMFKKDNDTDAYCQKTKLSRSYVRKSYRFPPPTIPHQTPKEQRQFRI